jgi:hypothetical protein
MVITGKPLLSVDYIVNELQNEDIGYEAAIAFQVIAGDSDILLNKQSFAKYSVSIHKHSNGRRNLIIVTAFADIV